jgi:hypothetical protein
MMNDMYHHHIIKACVQQQRTWQRSVKAIAVAVGLNARPFMRFLPLHGG